MLKYLKRAPPAISGATPTPRKRNDELCFPIRVRMPAWGCRLLIGLHRMLRN